MGSSSSSSNNKTVVLISADGETFVVEEEVAMQSPTIKHMIEDGSCVDTGIPLPNVPSNILSKVIKYCEKHVNPSSEEVLKAFDEEFMKDVVDEGTLSDLLLAANYLDIKGLLVVTGKATADMMKDMTCEEVRKTFNIKNDFAPGEEEATIQENPWAYVL